MTRSVSLRGTTLAPRCARCSAVSNLTVKTRGLLTALARGAHLPWRAVPGSVGKTVLAMTY